MTTLKQNINHQHGQTSQGCVAACLSMILEGVSEKDARKIGNTTHTGTNLCEAAEGLDKLGVKCHYISVDQPFEQCCWWLQNLSKHFPVIMGGHWKHKVAKKGQPRNLYHAVLLADNGAYDSTADGPLPIWALHTQFDKQFNVRHMIVFDTERPFYGFDRPSGSQYE